MYDTTTPQTATSPSTGRSCALHFIPNPGWDSASVTLANPALGSDVATGMSAGTRVARVRDAKQAAPPRGVPH